jgi:hypothetical protein
MMADSDSCVCCGVGRVRGHVCVCVCVWVGGGEGGGGGTGQPGQVMMRNRRAGLVGCVLRVVCQAALRVTARQYR